MLGGYISDLEAGGVFEPVEYVVTPFICSEYAHGVEENCEWFHSAETPAGCQSKFGRAAWMQDRAVGVKDAGATVMALVMKSLAEYVRM